MTNYYFLANLCSDISLDIACEEGFSEFMGYLKINLTEKDLKGALTVQTLIDLYNLRALWMNEPLDPRGSRSKEDLQEDISTKTGLKQYVLDFLEKYTDIKDYIRFFPALIAEFFKCESASSTGFLKKYLEFERTLRLVSAGYRSLALGRDLIEELIFEEPQDSVVSLLLMQKDLKNFEMPSGFESFKNVLEKYYDNPIDQFRAISQYRFDRIEEMKGNNIFSIDSLLGHLVQLLIIERWQEAKQEESYKLV
jgi:hypothetical protein